MSSFQRAQKIYDAISRRRSIRQYSSDDVSPDTVRRLISMAVMPPLAHNRQPWPFVVSRAESRTRQTRQRISSAHWRSPDSSMENPGNCAPRLGRVDKLNPDSDAGKQHEGGEALDQLVVAGGDTA